MPLYSRMSPRASSRVGPGRGPRGTGSPPGRCGRQVGDGHASGPELVRHARLVGAVHEHRVDAREEHRHEAGVAGVRLVREDVVAHDDRLRPRTGTTGHRTGGAQQRQVGRHDRRHDVHDEDGVDVAQPPPGAHPRVGSGPAERPDRPREGRHLGHRRRARTRRRGAASRGRGAPTTRASRRARRRRGGGRASSCARRRRPCAGGSGRRSRCGARPIPSSRPTRPSDSRWRAAPPSVVGRWPPEREPCDNASVMVLRL